MPTHYKGNRRGKNALDVYIKLMRASGAVHGRQAAVLRNHELTYSQFGVLETLLHLGPLNQKTVGEKLFFTEGNVTMVAANLESRGLIKRQKDPDDGRAMILTLTATGKKLIKKAFEDYVALLTDTVSTLNNAEQTELNRLLKKIGLYAQKNS